MKNIVIYCGSLAQCNFFKRLNSNLMNAYHMIFITTSFTVYKFLLNNKLEVFLVKAKKAEQKIKPEIIANLVEIALGLLKLEEGVKFYQTIWLYLDEIHRNRKIDILFFFQGVHIPEIAFLIFAKEHKIKKLAFEYSNVPGKIFCDREGSNKQSELHKNPGILDFFDDPEDEYKVWLERYKKQKFGRYVVPQSRLEDSLKNRLLDTLAGYFYTKLPDKQKSVFRIFNSFRKKIFCKIFYEIQYDIVDLAEIKDKFIFFPLQVSTDSQIVLNSGIGIIEALEYALQYAREADMELIVKPHPAETDKMILIKMNRLRKKYNFKIVNLNTFSLIINSYKVITINSTVGLESMILGKEPIVLGDAFYKNFDQIKLRKYLLRYLVNIDYFSDKEIKNAELLIRRSEFNWG